MRTHKWPGRNLSRSVCLPVFLCACCAPVSAVEYQFYASLRTQIEAVVPDNETPLVEDYVGLRDAYSRLGLKLSHGFDKHYSLLFRLEVPFDSANLEIQDPWNQEEHMRILKLQLGTPAGSIWAGKDWLPYYNAVAFPVDQLSSYYSGFSTYTVPRLDNTVAYISPNLRGFEFTGAFSRGNDVADDDRIQATASYTWGSSTIAIGVDDTGGPDEVRIYGAAFTIRLQNEFYIAGKYERFDSRRASGFGADGAVAANLLVSYRRARHTWTLMLADVDDYGENVFHFGWDYRLRNNLKLFSEVYYEQETAAITARRAGLDVFDPAASGGAALVFGFHFSFDTPARKLKLQATQERR